MNPCLVSLLIAVSVLTVLKTSAAPVYEWKHGGESGFSAGSGVVIRHDKENLLSFRTIPEKGGLLTVSGPDLTFGAAEKFERSFRIRTRYRVSGKTDFAQLRIRAKNGRWLEGDRKISENVYLLAFRDAGKNGEWITEERTFYLPPGETEGKVVIFLSPVKNGELQIRTLSIEETDLDRVHFIPEGGDPVIQAESGRVTVRIPDPENVLRATLSATVVSCCGVIGFVGLAVPHMVRMLCGGTFRRLLPGCILGGGLLLLLADLLARTVAAPHEIPVGILTALAGGPFFFYLLLRRRADRD